jgi:hypothetical protein
MIAKSRPSANFYMHIKLKKTRCYSLERGPQVHDLFSSSYKHWDLSVRNLVRSLAITSTHVARIFFRSINSLIRSFAHATSDRAYSERFTHLSVGLSSGKGPQHDRLLAGQCRVQPESKVR